MAKLMAFVHPDTGMEYPDSVWLPIGIYTDFSAPSGNVVFNGYPTQTLATVALKHSLGLPGGRFVAPVAQKSYPLSAAEVQALAASTPTPPNMIAAMSVPAYVKAMMTLDVPAPIEGQPDRKVSFFADATDVDLLA